MTLSFNSLIGQSDFNYQQPDQQILDLADAKPAPAIRLKDDATAAVLMYRNMFKSIEEMSAPEMKLAGIRVNPITNSPSRGINYTDVKILTVSTGKEHQVTGLPIHGKYTNFLWSYDQKMMAFTNTVSTGVE
ncbi:MAG: hypothetical protein WBO36_09810, partial [Saprospiraceae bacterium]